MASRPSPTSKIPKWNTPPPTPRAQASTGNDSKKSISATSSPRHISFRSKPAISLTSGSKIPIRPSEQPQNCNVVTPAKKLIATEQEARGDVVQLGGGEGDTPATLLDPSKTKDTPFLGIDDQYEEDDLDNALVGLIKPFSDRDFTKYLHISAMSEDETLETIKPPEVPADYVSSTNFMENAQIPLESSSSTFERKSTPMDLWLGAENSDVLVPPSMLEKLHGRTENLVNDLVNEAAIKATIPQLEGDCKEEAPIKEHSGEEDFSSQFEELVTKLGAPTKSETQIMNQMDLEEENAQLLESRSSLAEIQQVKSSHSRLRKYKVFLESSTDFQPKTLSSKTVVVPTTKTSSTHNQNTGPSEVELQLGNQTQEKLSRHDQLDDHAPQDAQKFVVENDLGSSIAQEEQIVREVDVSLPKLIVHEEVCEYTEESQSDVEGLGFGTTDTEGDGNESEDGDTCDDGEDMIIKLDQLNCNDAVIGKKARTIFSVDLSMSKIQVKHGAGENGDGNHNEERNATAVTSSVKSKSSFGAPSLPSLTRFEDPRDDSRITVVTREGISKPESHNSIHSLYSRKYNSGQRILKNSADRVDKQLELEDEESTSSDERDVLWDFEKQFGVDASQLWVESSMDQKHKKWLEQRAAGGDGIACRSSSSRLERVEAQLANVNDHIKEIFDKIVYYRTVMSLVVFSSALLLAIPAILPSLEAIFDKEKEPEPTWWESLFGSAQ